MRNEFEKQVQQKMEELNFVPSEPVWEKIEEQIRKKKDRRRAILWLPFLFLLLCGGLWWLNNTDEGRPSIKHEARQEGSNSPQTETKTPSANDVPVRVSTNQPTDVTTEVVTKENNTHSELPIVKETRDQQAPLLARKAAPEHRQTKNGLKKQQLNGNELPLPVITRMQRTVIEPAPEDADESLADKNIDRKRAVSQINIHVLTPHMVHGPKEVNVVPLAKPVVSPEDLRKSDSAAIVANTQHQQKKKNPKWSFGALAGAGYSNARDGIVLFGQEKNMNAAPLTFTNAMPPFANNSVNPAIVQKNVALSFGVVANRRLNKHFAFSTGLEYNYLSTRSQVGIMIAQSNAWVASSVNQFYISYGTKLQEYYSQYHFVSLPVSLSFQPLKKFPLQIQGGFSIKQLLKTNALKYDNYAQIYYYDKKAFNKTQLFTHIGFDYALLNKRNRLLLGPQLEYGFLRVEKTNSNQHLYTLQLRAQFLFSK